MSSSKASRIADSLAGPILGVGAMAVYAMTLSPGPFPDRSASLIVQHCGLLPRLTPVHPLWVSLASLLNKLPLGVLSWRMNIFSAVCGAACVWLLYEVMRRAILLVSRITPVSRNRVEWVARVAAATSAFTLMFCAPFWFGATRADTVTFDLLVLLCCLRMFMAAVDRPSGWRPLALAFFCGVAVVEFATMALFAPVFVILIVAALLALDEPVAMQLMKMIALFAAGLLFYLAVAGLFYGSEGYVLRAYHGFWHVVRVMVQDQYHYLTRSLPKVGWLLVLLTTIAPWTVALVVARRGLSGKEDKSFVALHVVMTALAATVILNLPIAPWPMLGSNNLLVTPYLLLSMLAGYLTAYWLLFPWNLWVDPEEPWRIRARLWLGPVLALPLIACAGFAPFRNAAAVDTAAAISVNEFAAQVVSLCDDGGTLVTEGEFDDQILILAAEMKRGVRLVNMADNGEINRRFVARMFPDPEISSMVDVSISGALVRLLQMEPDRASSVAVLGGVDLWTQAGLCPVPDRLVFSGRRSIAGQDLTEIMARHRAFWDATAKRQAESVPGRRGHWRPVNRTVAVVANELGFQLEDAGRQDLAFECYEKARYFDPYNLSAMFNMLALIERGFRSPLKDQLVKDVTSLCSDPRVQQRLDWLIERGGRTRSPRVLGETGWNQIGKGDLRTGIRDIETAVKAAPDNLRPMLLKRLAEAFLASGKADRAGDLFSELKAAAPADPDLDLGLARVAVARARYDSAADMLKSARQKGAAEQSALLIEAEIVQARGDIEGARDRLSRIVAVNPENWPAWGRFLDLIIRESNVSALADAVNRLGKLDKPDVYLFEVAQGYLALAGKDRRSARYHFALASDKRPAQVSVLEILLRLELEEGVPQQALRYARMLLEAAPSNAFAHYVIGTYQVEQSRPAEAEVSLRRSLSVLRTPEALNNLAWVLQEQGRLAEAEVLAREGIGIQPDSSDLWDTLGVVLRKAGRLDDAAQSLLKASALADKDPVPLIHSAEVAIEMGRREKALEFCDKALQVTPRRAKGTVRVINELRRRAGGI